MVSQLEVQKGAVTFYRMADRLFSTEAADEWAARVLEAFFNGFHLTPAAARPSDTVDCSLRLFTDDPPPIPPGLEAFELTNGVCYTDGESYYLNVAGSRIEVGSAASQKINVWFGRTREARATLSLVAALSYVLHMALRRCEIYDFHAAGLMEPARRAGVLLVGASDSGKTSLSIRLTLSGWSYMSDDMLALHERDGEIHAQGLRRPFSVSASSLAGCDLPNLSEALGAPVLADPTKRRLDPFIAFPGSFVASCAPRMLCFPSITGERESRFEPLGQAEVLTRLIRMSPWSSFDVKAREHLGFLGRLVRQAKAYSLLAGRDVFDDPTRAAALLSAQLDI